MRRDLMGICELFFSCHTKGKKENVGEKKRLKQSIEKLIGFLPPSFFLWLCGFNVTKKMFYSFNAKGNIGGKPPQSDHLHENKIKNERQYERRVCRNRFLVLPFFKY